MRARKVRHLNLKSYNLDWLEVLEQFTKDPTIHLLQDFSENPGVLSLYAF